MEKSRLLEIKPVGLFHSPVDREYIDIWIEKQPEAERPSLWTASLMTHNFLGKELDAANANLRALKPELDTLAALLNGEGAEALATIAAALEINLGE